MNDKWVTVYASSSDALASDFFQYATELGVSLALENYNLIYGGSSVGLMGRIAETMKNHGRKVIGIIPKMIYNKVPQLEQIDELILTDTMHQRKEEMARRGDAFICLPGGFGTLEEILEIITLKQLQYHNKAIVICNYRNSFNGLLNQFESLVDNSFAKPISKTLYTVVESPKDAVSYIKEYTPGILQDKWYDTKKKSMEKIRIRGIIKDE